MFNHSKGTDNGIYVILRYMGILILPVKLESEETLTVYVNNEVW